MKLRADRLRERPHWIGDRGNDHLGNRRPGRLTTQSPSDSWDAALYLRFEAEHAQPARDLLSRIEGVPRRIFDLGCGPGISSRLLVERFSGSEITGIDNSSHMLAETRRRLPTARFEKVDIARWRPNLSPDLIFANDALHWLPDHETLLPRLMSYLAERGSLAIQMPDDRHEPSHALMRLIAADGPWADQLVPVAKTRGLIGTFADYYNWLRPLSASIEIWQTTYVYPLTGVEAVVDWFRGSALPPFLNPLEQWEREEFLDRYLRGLSSAYGFEADGRVLFLYPRLFILARKPDEHGQSCKNPQSLVSNSYFDSLGLPRIYAPAQA